MDQLGGKFIVFDGGEGCGKSTQAHLLQDAMELRGVRTLFVRDPGATRIGEMVRQILLNPDHTEMNMRCEMLLYMAARAQMMAEKILPALAAGKCVVSDRFVSSTLAYQLGGDGLSAAEIRAVADVAINRRWPDLTIILDMPVEDSSHRVQPKFTLFPNMPDGEGKKDRIESRPEAYHRQVRANYLAQATADPARVKVVAANRDRQEVHADVMAILASMK